MAYAICRRLYGVGRARLVRSGALIPEGGPLQQNMGRTMKKPISELTALAIGAVAAASAMNISEKEPTWQLVYANDVEGNAVEGSKDELIESIREGAPVRVYWSGGGVEHVIDSNFLTVWGGEVFVQTPTIRGQRP